MIDMDKMKVAQSIQMETNTGSMTGGVATTGLAVPNIGPGKWRFCPSCGHTLDAGWNHCPICGVAIQFLAPVIQQPYLVPVPAPYPYMPQTPFLYGPIYQPTTIVYPNIC